MAYLYFSPSVFSGFDEREVMTLEEDQMIMSHISDEILRPPRSYYSPPIK